jgi:hypothetical protein
MAGENLTAQQKAFLKKHLKLKFYSGRHDKNVTEAYERYLLVEQGFKDRMMDLPSGDPRVQTLGGRAAPAMMLKNEGKFDEAAQALSLLIADARNLDGTLFEEHNLAVRRYQAAILPLPKDDPPTMVIINLATPSLNAPLARDVPPAVAALDLAATNASLRNQAIQRAFAAARQNYTLALSGLPLADPRVTGITGRASAPMAVTTSVAMPPAQLTLEGLKTECEQLKLTIGGEKTALVLDLGRLADPVGASDHEKAEMARHRDAATLAMTEACPAPDDFAAARKAMLALEKLIRASSQISLLPGGTATKAREAMEGFDAVLGDLEITPQVVADARTAREQAEQALYDASNDYSTAEEMPQDTEEEIRLRDAAMEQAGLAAGEAHARCGLVGERTRAILGKQMLGEALTVGALSPDTGRPLPDNAAQKIIDAFKTQPDIAKTALDLAQRSRDPDKLANALPMICDKVGDGFEHDGSAYSSASYARNYGNALLKQGDFLGGDYFVGLETYLDSGKQFDPSLIGDSNGKDEREITSTRSLVLAGAMLDSGGKLDLSGTKLRDAMQQMKYSPDATSNGTPVLTQHMLHTLDQLQQGNNGSQASTLIDGITAPTDKPSSDLVGVAVGKGKDATVTATETKQAVLKALMTPMDQGAVGSCFTTAPTRRFREEDPIGALTSLTEVATTGKFTSATGVRVPATANLPDGEDPILRSWEYSIASAAATEAGSRERLLMGGALVNNAAMNDIADLVGGTTPNRVRAAKNAIQTEMRAAFSFAYNPTKPVIDANDGSSSTGCYEIIEADEFGAPIGGPIETADQFIEVTTRRLLSKLNIVDTSDEGIRIAELIRDDMLQTVTPNPPQMPYQALSGDGYKPWDLQSGGLGLGPTRALYGNSVRSTETLPLPGNSPVPTEGERCKEVLLAILDQAQTDPTATYQTIDSRGCHEYNAVPSEGSLQALIGSTPTRTSENIDRLVEKGEEIAAKVLPVDRAQAIYSRPTQKWFDNESDPAAKQEIQTAMDLYRPDAPMNAAEVKRRIVECNKVAMEKIAIRRGGTATEIDDRKVAFFRQMDNEALDELAIDLAPPQVVYADTNWGDGKTHTYFVMMPDPTTGELRMWKRQDPPGKLTPMKREDWIDKNMHITK